MSVEIYSIGRVNVDVCFNLEELVLTKTHQRVKGGLITAGGSAANFAAQIAKLGGKVGLISCVGNDFYGQFMLKELTKVGVDISQVLVLDNQQTGIFLIITDSKGKKLVAAEPGANRFLEKYIFEGDNIVRATTIHIGGGFPILTERVVEIATTNGIIFSYDPGRTAFLVDLEKILPKTDLLFVNQDELKNYWGIKPTESSLKKFAKTFPGILVVKMGVNGAIATDGFEYCKSDAFEVKVVDTTGAGDAFAAGFVTAWTRSERIEQALHFANAVAALTIQRRGAQNGQPTIDQVVNLLANYGIKIDSILRTFRKRKR